MALVGYSDSEDSDTEVVAPTIAQTAAARPKKEPLINATGPRKIKVDLPAAAAPDVSKPEDRPAKRTRTGGAFSDFNALLPQPKRTAENAKKNGLGAKFSLKTSSAAAFSRDQVEAIVTSEDAGPNGQEEAAVSTSPLPPVEESPKAEEVKIVGNPMRFRPLSVANNKKKPKRPVAGAVSSPQGKQAGTGPATAAAAPAPKPAVSLFSLSHSEAPAAPQQTSDTYVPMIAAEEDADTIEEAASTSMQASATTSSNPLSAVADDLNLSEADRRRLFGRGARGAPVNITNFDMDEEYKRNEAFRASGEAVQHRAVRAVGSGKHSIQQLVNSAVGQRDALEDKWAEGRRNRGDAGNKYGW